MLLALKIVVLAFIQSVVFSVFSRSRNRDNLAFHLATALISNGIWFMFMRELVVSDMPLLLFVPFVIGMSFGSVFGMKVSMFIEHRLQASADRHLGDS